MAPASLDLAGTGGAGAGTGALAAGAAVVVFVLDEEKSIGLPSLSCSVMEKDQKTKNNEIFQGYSRR